MGKKVKNYSSGMVSRLGFSLATARDVTEILILDEVIRKNCTRALWLKKGRLRQDGTPEEVYGAYEKQEKTT